MQDYDALIARAEEIARAAHKGQKRRDGKPYITHPEAVYNIAITKKLIYWCNFDGFMPQIQALICMLCWLHDVFEDNHDYVLTKENLQTLFNGKLSDDMLDPLYNALVLLTKTGEYSEYIVKLKSNLITRYVKLADLTHNLSDSKPGSQRDKYRLAYFLLSDEQYKP